MIEWLISVPVVMGGVALAQRQSGMNDKKKIKMIFERKGIAVPTKERKPEYPKFIDSARFPKDKKKPLISTTYLYKLPIGMAYKPLEGINYFIMDALGKEVDVDQPKRSYLSVKVFERPLPNKVNFHPAMLQLCKDAQVLIGLTQERPIIHDFEMYQHLGVAGMTRYGKSVFLNLLITSLVTSMGDKARLHLFDLKGGVTFNKFSTLKQTVPFKDKGKEYRFVTNKDHALECLKQIERRIKQRERHFIKMDWDDVEEAREKGFDVGREFIIIDEAAVLAPRDRSDLTGKKCQKILEYIAQVGGGLGFSLVMCMQYPVSDVFPRQIKQNTVSQLSFKVRNETASKVILDEHGAEELPVKQKGVYEGGRAIYKTDRKTTLQVPYIDKKTVYELIEPFKLGEPDPSEEEIKEDEEIEQHFDEEGETNDYTSDLG